MHPNNAQGSADVAEAEPETPPQTAGDSDEDTLGASDRAAGFEITEDFRRFDQRNDVFRRSFWDERIHSAKAMLFYATYREPLTRWRKAPGFTQKDYAFRNAAWHVSDLFTEFKEDEDRREGFTDEFSLYRGVASEKVDMGSPAEAAAEIKHAARAFGADLVGVTDFDERWMYTKKFSDMSLKEKDQEIPEGMTSVIMVAQKMDYELIRTVPSALSGAATGLGYSRDSMVVLSIAQYIQNLGYQAVASMNDTALNIPLAIKAGLGEYGRLGLLITKEFGPRLRLGKIFTDMPLAPDAPIRFGVAEFCDICRRCSDACPVKAVPAGEPSAEPLNDSTLLGVRKWSVDGEKCFGYWVAQNSDCAICMRVCPYNKDYTHPLYRIGRWLAGTRLRRFMLWLDVKLGYGKRMAPRHWWTPRA